MLRRPVGPDPNFNQGEWGAPETYLRGNVGNGTDFVVADIQRRNIFRP